MSDELLKIKPGPGFLLADQYASAQGLGSLERRCEPAHLEGTHSEMIIFIKKQMISLPYPGSQTASFLSIKNCLAIEECLAEFEDIHILPLRTPAPPLLYHRI